MENDQQKEEIKQIVQEEQTPTEKDHGTNQQEAAMEDLDNIKVNEEEKTVPALDNVAEAVGEIRPTAQAAGRDEENQKDSTRKSNQASKPNLKLKATLPQPFSLATEKRILSRERRGSVDFSSLTDQKRLMSKERRGSVDFKDLQPKLTKSVSLNHKTQSSPGPGFGENSKPKHASSIVANTKPNSKIKVSTRDQRDDDKKIEIGLKNKHRIQVNKEVESRYLQVTAKNNQKGEEHDKDNKLRKSSLFKASPLPSFYHRKNPPSKPETNKLQSLPTQPIMAPVIGQRSKSMLNGDEVKVEEKGNKTVSRTISTNHSARETIRKLFKSTKRTLTGSKQTVKGVAASA